MRIIKRRKLIIITLIIAIFSMLSLNIKIGFANSSDEYTLITGEEFNLKIKSIVSETDITSYTTKDTTLLKIIFDKYDEEKYGVSGSISYLKWEDGIDIDTSEESYIRLFYDSSNKTAYVLAKDNHNIIFNSDSKYMFSYFNQINDIDFGDAIDTSKVTNMSSMFRYCENITSLDLTSFNTSKVINMSSMFSECYKIEKLDISSFDTSNVTNMYCMFCRSNVTNLDLSNFDTSNVTGTGMVGMFMGNHNLVSLDLSTFDTSKVTNMLHMFSQCYKLESINLSSFDTSNVTDMSSMFWNSSKLETIYISQYDSETNKGWNTSKVTSSGNMFEYCDNLVGGYGSSYKELGSTDKTYAVIDSPTQQGYLTLKQDYSHDLNSSYILDNNENLMINFSPLLHYITDAYITNDTNTYNLEENTHYSIVDGNLVLKNEYLNLLEIGEYKLHIKNKDSVEENIINLKVTDKIISIPENTEENNKEEISNSDNSLNNANIVANTSDNIKKYIILLAVSMINFIYLTFFIVRKDKKEEEEIEII